jgi:hypothetical protein
MSGDDDRPELPSDQIDFCTPHSARIWNYWQGGKHHYDVDREAGDAFAEVFPDILPMAVQARQFLVRVVRFLAAEAGVRQFLDIGTGLPATVNTHEVAQSVAPASRIVYVDNDPLVLVNARVLLRNTTAEGVTTYIDADFHDPERILADARNVLNFTEPVAVMFMGVLGHVAEFAEMRSIVQRMMAGVPCGSYLALYDSPNEDPRQVQAVEQYAATGAVPYRLRSREQLLECFEGLEMIDPGFVRITEWHPDDIQVGIPRRLNAFGAVARKP